MKLRKISSVVVWTIGLTWLLAACQPFALPPGPDDSAPIAESVAESVAETQEGSARATDAPADATKDGEEDAARDVERDELADMDPPQTPATDSTPLAEEPTAETQEEVQPVLVGTVTFTATIPFSITMSAPVVSTLTPTATVPLTDTPPLTGTPTVTATATLTATPPSTTPPPATPTPPASPVPPPTGSPTVGPTSTPLPTGVVLRTHRTFIEGSDRIVVGEVINGLAASVYNVRVIATFYDSAGQLVGAQETVTFLPETQPRQTNPFRLVLRDAPASIANYELSLVWEEINLTEFDRVTIVSEKLREEGGQIHITGELRNDHRQAVADLRVVAAFYDADGAIVNVFVGTVAASQLEPDATTTYAIQAYFLGDAFYHTYLVQTQGVLAR